MVEITFRRELGHLGGFGGRKVDGIAGYKPTPARFEVFPLEFRTNCCEVLFSQHRNIAID
jgi:hypothetical protein